MDQYWKRYHRDYYYKRRQEVFDYLGYRHCVKCGSEDGLEIDHIDPALKSFNLSSALSPRQQYVRDELDKCQLLCRPCHEQKTASENSGFRHGTIYAWMNKKCRCDECKPAWREWQDRRNAERRLSHAGGRGVYGRPTNHGEILHYRRGCRCDQCRAANTAYARTLRANRSASED